MIPVLGVHCRTGNTAERGGMMLLYAGDQDLIPTTLGQLRYDHLVCVLRWLGYLTATT
jgi:hypothetical protein